jgi:hypothetical protein
MNKAAIAFCCTFVYRRKGKEVADIGLNSKNISS